MSEAAATKGERTSSALVSAAIVRFALDGYIRTSVSDIARDVRISPAAVYRYFPDKEALFVAAVDADAASLVDLAAGLLTEGYDGDLRALMLRTSAGLADALRDHPLVARVMAGREPMTPERILALPHLKLIRGQLETMLRFGQAAGRVRPELDPALMALGVETLVLYQLAHLATLRGTGSEPSLDDARFDSVAALVDAAIRPYEAPVKRSRKR